MKNDYCKNVCDFDLSDYTCTACGRTQEEVTEWFIATEDRKKEIAKTARKRNKDKKLKDIEVLDGEWDWVLDAIDGKIKSK